MQTLAILMAARGLVVAGRMQRRGFRVQLTGLVGRSRSGMYGRPVWKSDGGGLESAGVEKAAAGVRDGAEMMAGADVVIFLVATSIGGDSRIFVPSIGIAAVRSGILRHNFGRETPTNICYLLPSSQDM